MSDLYKAGEMVWCFCTKCGWSGEAAAPMFSCGGCGKYVAAPLDHDKRRAEAAEAELNVARTRWQTLVNTVAGAWNNGLVPGNDDECVTWAIEQIKSRAALSDTAQQETGEPRTYVNRRAIDMD